MLDEAHFRAMAVQDVAGRASRAGGWWPGYLEAYFAACGVPEAGLPALAEQAAAATTRGVWTYVRPGTKEGLRALAALGLPMGVVSNADGRLQAQLARLGLCYVPGSPERGGPAPGSRQRRPATRASRRTGPRAAGVPVGVVADSTRPRGQARPGHLRPRAGGPRRARQRHCPAPRRQPPVRRGRRPGRSVSSRSTSTPTGSARHRTVTRTPAPWASWPRPSPDRAPDPAPRIVAGCEPGGQRDPARRGRGDDLPAARPHARAAADGRAVPGAPPRSTRPTSGPWWSRTWPAGPPARAAGGPSTWSPISPPAAWPKPTSPPWPSRSPRRPRAAWTLCPARDQGRPAGPGRARPAHGRGLQLRRQRSRPNCPPRPVLRARQPRIRAPAAAAGPDPEGRRPGRRGGRLHQGRRGQARPGHLRPRAGGPRRARQRHCRCTSATASGPTWTAPWPLVSSRSTSTPTGSAPHRTATRTPAPWASWPRPSPDRAPDPCAPYSGRCELGGQRDLVDSGELARFPATITIVTTVPLGEAKDTAAF